MRVTTDLIYSLGVDAINRQQEHLLRTQQQLASGQRMLSPSDDPIASAQALNIDQAARRNNQYSANIGTAKDALAADDSVLAQVASLLQSVRTQAVNAGNGTLNDSDRASIATDVAAQLEQLIGLANSKDGNGNYVYAGFQVGTQPFTSSSGGAAYHGDQGQATIDVAPGRTMPTAENGSALFLQVRNGNGHFATGAASTNTGSGVIDAGQVANPAAITGDTYRLQFTVAGAVTTYDVIDVTTAAVVSTGNAYTNAGSITVAGMQVSIRGAPANGDQFTLAPSSAQSIFATLQNLVTALRTPASGASGTARLGNDLNAALANVDQSLEHVLTVRAGVGARLRELDSLAAGNDDRRTQFDQTLSGLRDLDYNKALSDFARQQLSLDAAQKSFLKISGLSLFSKL